MNQKKVYSTIGVMLLLSVVILICGKINSTDAKELSINKQVSGSSDDKTEKETELNNEYKKIVSLVNKYKDGITKLVNKENALNSDYEPNDLVKVNVESTKDNIYMSEIAAENLENMFKAAKEDGINLYIVSGYRSSSYQNNLYYRSLKRRGREYTEKYVAQANHSEHQTGLAADISSESIGYKLISAFEHTEEGRWLDKNAYKYGFILRYPFGKEDITKYSYEPWHLRYVGNVAKSIYNNDITLEEYLNNVKECKRNRIIFYSFLFYVIFVLKDSYNRN